MFETLTHRFEAAFTKLRGRGRLTTDDVDSALSDIRVALLEADVNLDVVSNLTGRIRQRAVGEELSKALNPAQQVVKIVLAELTVSLGGERLAITYASKPPTVVLLAGLQGSGKTTNAAKLAQWFLRQGRSPLLVGADLQRPAAVEQLRTLGGRVGVPVFSHRRSPVKAASASLAEATRTGRDVVIVDTAGRLAIDAEMMDQVRRISKAVQPDYTFLVVDATVGQDAVNSARTFHETLSLDGVILTKLDGDARGGAALSVREVVGRPIAFASVGEKLEDFEPFHPDRLASRILGMGDVETLIDKAEAAFEAEQAEQTASRLLEGTFTFDDFLSTMQQVLGMGNLRSLIGMMPGMPQQLRDADIDESRITRVTGMIHSMTPGRARRSRHHRRFPAPAHRGRLGLPPGRRQVPGRPVQADAVHDEGARRSRRQARCCRVEDPAFQAVRPVETEVGLAAARRRPDHSQGSGAGLQGASVPPRVGKG